MCSIGEEDFGDEGGAHAMVEDVKIENIMEDSVCKCNQEKCVIKLDLKNAMCKSCFLLFVRHKFRAALGATKVLARDSRILVCFSGGANDVCLLSMTKLGIEDFSFKKLCVDLEVVFIDDGCTESFDVHERLKKIEKVREVVAQFEGINCHYASISDPLTILNLNSVTKNDLESAIVAESCFMKKFNALQSLTSKQDFLDATKTENLRQIALLLSCSFVFISDICIIIAKRLMHSVALGRGSSVAHDVSFCDDRVEHVKILRPLKDLSKLEVENYNKFNGIDIITTQPYGIRAGHFASIQNATSNFIDGIQENFSSTVSTVYKACSKVAPKISENQSEARCQLCLSSLDYENSDTLFAIEFSRVVSEMADQQMKNIKNCEEKAKNAVEGGEVVKNLCHGCRNIFIGLNEDELREIF